MSAVDHMHSYAQIARAYANNTEPLATAVDSLYASLTDTQRQAADTLFRQQASTAAQPAHSALKRCEGMVRLTCVRKGDGGGPMALQRASRGIPLGQSKRRVLAEGPMKEKGSGGSDGAIQLATDNAPPHRTRKKGNRR